MKSLRFRQMSASMPSRLRTYRGMTRAFAAPVDCGRMRHDQSGARSREGSLTQRPSPACSGSRSSSRFRQDFVKIAARGVKTASGTPHRPPGRLYLRFSSPCGAVQQSPAGALRRGRVNNTMTIVAAVVAVLLLGYLVVALVRPEKF